MDEENKGIGHGIGKAAEGLGDVLGGVLGGLGKTVGGVTGVLQGVVGKLLGPLQQLQKRARSGDENAQKEYKEAVSMMRKSSDEGNQDADKLLQELGEALNKGDKAA